MSVRPSDSADAPVASSQAWRGQHLPDAARRPRHPRGARSGRQHLGFTLVELLTVIAIIGILATLSLGAMWKATDRAKVTRTRAMVIKLHAQVLHRWESYRTRRLPINVAVTAATMGLNPNNTSDLSRVRLIALRELMRRELPQKFSDIALGSQLNPPMPPSALTQSYLRRLNSVASPDPQYQGAECLYMIVTMGEDDSLGTDRFSPKNIGDRDGDGLREFQDAWGNPISFLRWAPGFVSELQPDVDPTTVGVQRDNQNDHDPFDPMRLDPGISTPNPFRGYKLTPLIYSSGSDESDDITVGIDAANPSWGLSAAQQVAVANDPFYDPASNSLAALPAGTPLTTATTPSGLGEFVDNIHNHVVGQR